MPTYKLPPLKDSDDGYSHAPVNDSDKWMRRVDIPISKKILDELKAGKKADVTLKGKVNSLSEKDGVCKMELEISEVSAYSHDPAEDMSQSEYEEYRNKRR